MKALVLAGGRGKRMRPFTHTSAKQLVPVGNRPVLFFGLAAIAATGITDVGIVVGETAREVAAAVGDGSAFGLRVTYIRQRRPLGLAHAVLVARRWLGDDDFIMYLGDNFVEGGVEEVAAELGRSRPGAHLLVTQVPDPRAFGVVELGRDGQITRLVEKPEEPTSDLAIIGIYAFTPVIHEAVRRIKPSDRGELEITQAVQWLIDAGHDVRATRLRGYWKDVGNVADLLEVNRLVLAGMTPSITGDVDDATQIVGSVTVARGADVRASRIVGPVVVGRDASVRGSSIGPFTSVGDACRISDSGIENSILLPGSCVEGVRQIEASLIGRYAVVTPAPRVAGAHRLILGDHSRLQIGS
ncbi:glucose-1-phosphate thymidylyltransferase [Actinoallomurus acanthiterrae]